jgi:hypothetical protein
MNWKREIPALVFGMLIILVIFGDAAAVRGVGNLDTVFGTSYWPLMDVIYPLASIAVFLLYGQSKGGIQIQVVTILAFLALLAGLLIIQFDDIFQLFNHPITLPQVYWTTARWLYLFISIGSFLTFGQACQRLKARPH